MNETWLELTNFVHGSNWAIVYDPKYSYVLIKNFLTIVVVKAII
jgi:hypothetical protein